MAVAAVHAVLVRRQIHPRAALRAGLVLLRQLVALLLEDVADGIALALCRWFSAFCRCCHGLLLLLPCDLGFLLLLCRLGFFILRSVLGLFFLFRRGFLFLLFGGCLFLFLLRGRLRLCRAAFLLWCGLYGGHRLVVVIHAYLERGLAPAEEVVDLPHHDKLLVRLDRGSDGLPDFRIGRRRGFEGQLAAHPHPGEERFLVLLRDAEFHASSP